MKSIFGLRDLDCKIAEYLSDEDLKSLNRVNKYYMKIYDNAFYRRRFYHFYNSYLFSSTVEMNIYNESWKKFYFCTMKWINECDHIKSVEFCIEEDRADILSLIFIKNNYRKNGTIYGWCDPKQNCIVPVIHCIKKDSLNCYKYINDTMCIDDYQNFYRKYHAHKIKQYWYEKEMMNSEQIYREALFAFKNDCECCYNIIKDKIEFNDMMELLIFMNDKQFCYKKYNKTFHLFVTNISYSKIIKYKEIAMKNNRLDIIKLLTKYSSPFSNF